MKSITKIILSTVFLFTIGMVITTDAFEITYISIEGVYINAGTQDGLQLGDSLEIYRNDSLQAVIVVTNTASHSSACKIAQEIGQLLVGDLIIIDAVPVVDTPKEPTVTQPKANSSDDLSSNNLNGSISFQNYWQKDMTGSSLSYVQPGLVSRMRIDRFTGHNLTLKIRHRSRLNHRSRSLGSAFKTDEWYHRVYEFAVVSDSKADFYWAVGRQTVSEMSGIGLVDGFLLAKKLSSTMTAGAVIGYEPDWETTDISTERKKAGLFVRWENANQDIYRMTIHGALVGSYYKSEVNREFFSLNNSFSYNNKLYLYNSMEIDFYRSWRKERAGKTFSVTNLYLNARYQVVKPFSLFVSYDRRENIRYYESLLLPDSLFNDATNQGVKAGYNLKISTNIRMNGYGGVRIRDGVLDNNKYGSVAFMINRFPKRSNATSLRFSYVKTEFTTGYRPSIQFRFPLSKTIRMSLTNTMYHYSGSGLSRSYYYLDLNGNYYRSSDYFINGSYRQYFSGDSKSGQLFFEVGLYL